MAPKTSSIHTISDIRCAIFDLDGTLIDSVPVYLQLMETIFKAIGLPPAPKQLVSEFMNGGGLKVIEKHIPPELQHHKETILKRFKIAGRNTSQTAFKSRIKVFDGVQPLFLRLSALAIPIGIVTSTERAHIHRKLRLLEKDGLTQYLDAVIVIEDAPRKKPAPDPLLVCSERLGVNVENCIYVGDSHVDIRAANGAGMTAIGVLSGLDDHETLMAEKPHMILENVNELVKVF
ncbi:putative phosphoglycolate phosphatase, bacterial [delta proteobacterium NaphS2]|nr:putative phosphoglycolate phosphatase, bacterial [delta proteobacterium NaphS2]